MQKYRNVGKRIKMILFSLFIATGLFAQGLTPQDKLKNDFPQLTARYGTQIGDQKAHYVFVLDISSSMLPYESIEKQNLLKFVDAVPDGDQITIIRMADEKHTDFVNMFKCITLEPNVRQALRTSVQSPGFQFLKNGDPRDGSDGFKTASLIVDAINTVGSNELTFIYLFTDFEYWTHTNRYNKNGVDWQSLVGKVPESYRQGMCKFGIELATNSIKHPEAIFKPEMDRIFGTIHYQPVTSAAVLSQWFGHIITNVMAYKLNASLKKEWNSLIDTLSIETSLSGNQLTARVIAPEKDGKPLISKTDILLSSASIKSIPVEGLPIGKEDYVGLFKVDRGFWPQTSSIDCQADSIELFFHSDYKDEITRLQTICNEKDGDDYAMPLHKKYPLSQSDFSVWASVLPLWCWILIALIIFIIVASILYTIFVLKTSHPWMVRVKEDGMNVKSPAPSFEASFTVGKGGDFPVPNANWQIKVNGKKYNPLMFWKKSGYYMVWTGGPMTIKDQYREEVAACAPNEETWFSPLKSGGVFIIEKNNHRIELVV